MNINVGHVWYIKIGTRFVVTRLVHLHQSVISWFISTLSTTVKNKQSGYLGAFYPTAPVQIPKHNIYAFFNFYIWNWNLIFHWYVKGTKIDKKEVGISPCLKNNKRLRFMNETNITIMQLWPALELTDNETLIQFSETRCWITKVAQKFPKKYPHKFYVKSAIFSQ